MKNFKNYDDFTDVLNRMNNDDFALLLTGYAESIGRDFKLLPIHIDKFDCLAWVGYFTEDGGLNGDEENRFIVTEILENAYCSDYVLIEEGEEELPKLTFFTGKELKKTMFNHYFVYKFFKDKKAWSEPLYENGRSNDTYVAFSEYLTDDEKDTQTNIECHYDLFAGILYIRDNNDVEVDSVGFIGTDVCFDFINKIDANLSEYEKIGIADTFIYDSEKSNRNIYVKKQTDFDLINSLPNFKGCVKLVNEFPNE